MIILNRYTMTECIMRIILKINNNNKLYKKSSPIICNSRNIYTTLRGIFPNVGITQQRETVDVCKRYIFKTPPNVQRLLIGRYDVVQFTE